MRLSYAYRQQDDMVAIFRKSDSSAVDNFFHPKVIARIKGMGEALWFIYCYEQESIRI